jgi:Fe-S-cluster containining protein
VGPFPITLLDARRLREGLRELQARKPERAAAIRRRAAAAVRTMQRRFPGDPATGRLNEDEAARERFFERHETLPCPALDPRTGACELYEARPLTCRTFGPPVRIGRENLPPCRLCFIGEGSKEVARCRVGIDDAVALEDRLLRRLQETGEPAVPETVVASALVALQTEGQHRVRRGKRRGAFDPEEATASPRR